MANGNTHVATLVVGQVMRRHPRRQVRFYSDAHLTPCGLPTGRWKLIEGVCRRAPIAPKNRFEATVRIIRLFAKQLADEAERLLIACQRDEPPWLTLIRQWVQSADQEPVTMSRAAQRTGMSVSHFCKLFKKTADMTFTQYVAHVRVEKAKTLLRDPFARVSEVAFAAGFGSIPQFNNIFRKMAGMSPTEFRASLRTKSSV